MMTPIIIAAILAGSIWIYTKGLKYMDERDEEKEDEGL